MDNVDRNIAYIENLCERIFPKPKENSLKKNIFLYESYSHWAANELILYIYDNYKKGELSIVIESFIKKMDEYACASLNHYNGIPFSIAKDVGELVLDYYISLNGKA